MHASYRRTHAYRTVRGVPAERGRSRARRHAAAGRRHAGDRLFRRGVRWRIQLGNRYTIPGVSKHDMLKMLLVLHPHHCILEEYVEAIGADRICFGTDAPLYWPVPFGSMLQTTDLGDDTREKIAWRNARQAFPRLAC
jgi:hypothetical protein